MQNENRKNPQELNSPESGHTKAGESQSSGATTSPVAPEDFTRMKNWVQQARSDAERARTIAEQTREDIKDIQMELDDHGRKTSRSGWTASIVALALIAACIYGYFKLQTDESLLAEFPAAQSALNSVSQRVNAAEEKFRAWSGDWDAMNSRLAKVEKSAGANLRQARDYAVEQAANVHHELQAEMDNRSRSTDSAINKLEATHTEDQQKIAQLQQEIASVRSETTDQLAQSKRETGQEVGDLRSEINRSRDDLDTVAHSLGRRRLDFEISRDQTREVAPGITLTVSKTDVSYQRVEGRLHVIADGRILWIRGQGIQQPVRFYSHTDERPFEVVFTRVAPESAVGYVLAPSGDAMDTATRRMLGDQSTRVAEQAATTDGMAQLQ